MYIFNSAYLITDFEIFKWKSGRLMAKQKNQLTFTYINLLRPFSIQWIQELVFSYE